MKSGCFLEALILFAAAATTILLAVVSIRYATGAAEPKTKVLLGGFWMLLVFSLAYMRLRNDRKNKEDQK